MPERTFHVQSVSKAVRLIDCLAAAKRPLSLQELSQAAGIPKTTAFGLLAPMREAGWAEQNEAGRYRLGVRLFELGSIVSASWNIVPVARPQLQMIALQTGQSAQLSMIDKTDVLLLDNADPGSSLRIVSETGDRLPVHSTAAGKAVLAYLSPMQARSILRAAGMPSFTPHTITGMENMEAAFEQIRAQGFAVEDGETRIGLRSVAAPVFDVTGAPRYAISVLGMFRRVSEPDFQVARELVESAARFVSKELGYNGGSDRQNRQERQ